MVATPPPGAPGGRLRASLRPPGATRSSAVGEAPPSRAYSLHAHQAGPNPRGGSRPSRLWGSRRQGTFTAQEREVTTAGPGGWECEGTLGAVGGLRSLADARHDLSAPRCARELTTGARSTRLAL